MSEELPLPYVLEVLRQQLRRLRLALRPLPGTVLYGLQPATSVQRFLLGITAHDLRVCPASGRTVGSARRLEIVWVCFP